MPQTSFYVRKPLSQAKGSWKALAFLFFPSVVSQLFPFLEAVSFYHNPEHDAGRKTNQELKGSCKKPPGAGKRALLTLEQLVI